MYWEKYCITVALSSGLCNLLELLVTVILRHWAFFGVEYPQYEHKEAGKAE